MKTYYICEICNKHHNTEAEAIECENKHKAEQEKREQETKKKKELVDCINRGINLYIEKYGEIPPITIKEEHISKAFGKVFDDIMDMFKM